MNPLVLYFSASGITKTVAEKLAEVSFSDIFEEVLRRRLIDRKEAIGYSRDKAEAFVDFSDMRNVKLCLNRSKPADLELTSGADGSVKMPCKCKD